jgi:hypothetical protein
MPFSRRTKQILLWFGLFLALASSFYCFLGIVQLGSFSVAGNYPREYTQDRFNQWAALMVLSIGVGGTCAILLGRAMRR